MTERARANLWLFYMLVSGHKTAILGREPKYASQRRPRSPLLLRLAL